MLHGIVALCPRTGSLLWSKAYAPSFGLPPPPGGQPIDAHNLASLIFALQLNAAATLSGGAGGGAGAPALRSVDMGPGLRLVFYRDPELPGLLLALALDPALGPGAEQRLAESVCAAFATAYGEQLLAPAGPVRRLRGATELVQQALASVSRALLDELLHTFSARGVVLWGHAMQPDAADLLALRVVPAAEVPGGPGAAGWQALGDQGGTGGGQLGQEPAMPAAGAARGHRFDGVVVVGSPAVPHGGGDSPGCGSKRKAPEKLLSTCSKVRILQFTPRRCVLLLQCCGYSVPPSPSPSPTSLFLLLLLPVLRPEAGAVRACGAPPLTRMARGRFSGGRSGASGTRKRPLACTLRARSRSRAGALAEACSHQVHASAWALQAPTMAGTGPPTTFCATF